MKTLLFTLEYPPFKGGVAKMYENIVKYWPEQNGIYVLNNNNNRLLKPWLRPRWILAVFKLLYSVKKHKIDHILVGHILPLGLPARRICQFSRTRYSVILHGMDFEYAHRTRRKSRQAAKILSGASKIICGNSYLLGRLLDRYPHLAEIAVVVNPGIETPPPADQDRVNDLKEGYYLRDKIVYLFLGRLVKRKGVDVTLTSFKDLVSRVPSAYFVIAGDGPDKDYLKNLAKGIPNVIFLGQVSDEDKQAWLYLCDILVMPSRDIDGDYEGFGIVYLEAAVCGKPVIAGDSGGIRDAVLGARTGIIIDGTKTDRLAGAMLALCQDKDLRNKMGQAGRERALKDFQWKDKAREIHEVIL